MESLRFKRLLADIGTWMVANRSLCGDNRCLAALMGARLRYAALRHHALAPALLAMARQVESQVGVGGN